jgi:Brp/Blh family beta-carotene 15,15'-monooxygenase
MAIDVRAAAATGRTLAAGARWSRHVVLAAIGLSLVVTTVPAGTAETLDLVLVGLGLLAGLPHGSIDHRIAVSLSGQRMSVVVLVYAGVAAGSWVLLTTAGPIALLAILSLSVAHFGLGELEILRAVTGWRPSQAIATAIGVAGTGALLLPLARSGVQLADVAEAVSPSLAIPLGNPFLRAGLAGMWVLAAVVVAAAAVRAGHAGVALDVAIVGALGALAPPLVAFTVWFGGWHAVRHYARLLTVDAGCAHLLADGQVGRGVAVLARAAAWPTLAAAAVIAVLVLAAASADDPTAAIGTTIVVLLALSVPHMLIVMWLDRTCPATCS